MSAMKTAGEWIKTVPAKPEQIREIQLDATTSAWDEAIEVLQTTPIFTEPPGTEEASLARDAYFHHVLDTIALAMDKARIAALEKVRKK
jgi:hypothetical protein